MFAEKDQLLKESERYEGADQKNVAKQCWVLLGYCGTVLFLAGLTVTVMTPFYSVEARTRQISPQVDGLIFGTYQLIMLLFSPILGKKIAKIGPVRIFKVSSVLLSVALVLFGCLELIWNAVWFVLGSCFFRILQAISCTAVFASCFVAISSKSSSCYPGTMFAGLQTFVSLGIALGPTFGGFLYDIGGFHSPFFVIAGLLLLTRGMVSYFLKADKLSPNFQSSKKTSVLNLLRIPSVAASSIGMLSSSITLGFLSTALESHLREFSLSSTSVGEIMAVNGLIFAVFAPLWGFICDKSGSPLRIHFVGNLLVFVAFFIIGPAPFIPIEASVSSTVLGLTIQGLGAGASSVSMFSVALLGYRTQFGTDANADGIISTLWQALMSLGIWIGSSLSGIVLSWIGFRDSCYLFFAIALIPIVLTLLALSCDSCSSQKGSWQSRNINFDETVPFAISCYNDITKYGASERNKTVVPSIRLS